MQILLPARDYNLAATLDSGQVFRWEFDGEAWQGIVGKNFLRLKQTAGGIHAEAAVPLADWGFLREYLQIDADFQGIIRTFPDDEPMRAALAACHGLRLLRQDPWECLASFMLSSTKRIAQIRQVVSMLCTRYGEPISRSICPEPGAHQPTSQSRQQFPSPQRLASCTEQELRSCKMGFRAPGLLDAARKISVGSFDLEGLRSLDYRSARAELMSLQGVGPKIADCVLLFAYGFDSAFPVDVWVERALQKLYFPTRRANGKRLRKFASTHFGPHAGYAQQYLFHYMRTGGGRPVIRKQP